MMLGACQPGPVPTEPTAAGGPVLAPAPLAFAQVQGFVLTPAGVVAAGSANVIAPGGGNFRTLAAGDRPLVGAEVLLADAAGRPIPGYASTVTDAQGHYTLAQVPQGVTFSVVVRARNAQEHPFDMRTLVTTRPDSNQANVTVGTMLATALLTEGREGALGELDTEKFQAIVSHLDTRYNADSGNDLSDAGSVVGLARALLSDAPGLQDLVAGLKAGLANVKAPLPGLPSSAPSDEPSAPTPAPSVDGVTPGGSGGGASDNPAPTLSLAATSHTGVASGLGITVRHAAANDMSGALVYVPGTNLVAIAAADGTFRIDHVPASAAPYTLRVTFPNHAAGSFPVTVTPGAPTAIGTLDLPTYSAPSPGPTGAVGVNGSTWHTGAVLPADALGVDGDFYLKTDDSFVYRKASGTWAFNSDLRGSQGATGPTGPAGPQGLTGPQVPSVLRASLVPKALPARAPAAVPTGTTTARSSGTWRRSTRRPRMRPSSSTPTTSTGRAAPAS
jgi:hypothetical protein